MNKSINILPDSVLKDSKRKKSIPATEGKPGTHYGSSPVKNQDCYSPADARILVVIYRMYLGYDQIVKVFRTEWLLNKGGESMAGERFLHIFKYGCGKSHGG